MTDPDGRFLSLEGLLRPQTVAIVGASADPTRIGGRPLRYMLERGFAGAIWPVNPNRAEVQGVRAFTDIGSLPSAPDTAIVAVPTPLAIEAVARLAALGTGSAVVFTAGFAETDAVGADAQEALVRAAGPMRLLGPNCLGLFNDRAGYYPTFSSSLESGWPPSGRIGIVSQSGAYGTHVFAVARNRGIGTPICVTTGNEADVTVGDVIGWMAHDPETDVIAAYAEGIRRADTFLAALAAAHRAKKPIVLMKVGTSLIGEQAARSHTASIAGDDRVIDSVLAEFGVVRARTTEEMLDIALAATRRIYPSRNTLGVITISGGAGVLISDAAEKAGLPLPPLSEDTQAKLKSLLPFAAPRNPVDCTAQAFNDISLVGRFMRTMVEEGRYTSILAFFSQVGGAPTIAPSLRAQLRAVRDQHPSLLYALSVVADPEQVAGYEQDGYIVFEDPTRAVVALHAMGRFGDGFARAVPVPPPPLPPVLLPAANPSEAEAKRILATAGLACAPEIVCATPQDAAEAAERLGCPVVLKIVSPDLVHKSEVGGVLLDVADPDAARTGFSTLVDRVRRAAPAARIDGVLVAKLLSGGVECLLGIKQDPVFGPVAVFGLGGIYAEVLDDVALQRCPFSEIEAEQLIRSIRGAPLLLGARGRKAVDLGALARMLAALSQWAVAAGPRLQSVDLNPVLAQPEGAFALDAVIEVSA